MPAVNYDLMLQEMLTKTAGKVNQVIYWGRPLDWHNQTLTPNPDTLYFMAFLNATDVGPIVIDVPPAQPWNGEELLRCVGAVRKRHSNARRRGRHPAMLPALNP
jgi:hypothetical protein